MSGLLRMLAVAGSLLLCACLPVSTTTPIGTTVGLGADPALVGMWRGQAEEQGNAIYLTFFPQEDGTMKMLAFQPPSKEDKSGWSVFGIRTATLASNHYINASELEDDGKRSDASLAATNIPLLYEIGADGSLKLYLIDEDAAKAAIKAGRIAGQIEKGDSGDVHITAPAAQLDAFFATGAGRALFRKPFAVLRRVPR